MEKDVKIKANGLIVKFGGTSVGDSEALRQAAAIICSLAGRQDWLAVVVSAMSGVTDSLQQAAKAAAAGQAAAAQTLLDNLAGQHHQAVDSLFTESQLRLDLLAELDGLLAELAAYISGIQIMGEVTPRGMDAVMALGERMSARLFSALLNQNGLLSEAVDATRLIVTDDCYQFANPLMDATCGRMKDVLLPLIAGGMVPVVTGFIAATQEGITTTLGRGGSDFSAALLGACLDAAGVWTYTDVDGVMTADPRIVPDARVIPQVSFREISEMAYFGAKVLHPKAIRPLIMRGIPLWVKNTFNPEAPGTCIVEQASAIPGRVTAVTAIQGLSIITVEGRGMLGVPGIAARTFAAVARVQASVLMISQSSSEQSICFIIPSEAEVRVVRSIEQEMALELTQGNIDRIWALPDVVIVTAIGNGMRQIPGVAARLFGALGREQINVIAIAQGSSEYCISVVVSAVDGDAAVRQIHHEVVIHDPA